VIFPPSQIEHVSGKRLASSTLFRGPTIAQLAIVLEQPMQHQSQTELGTELVAIQPHGFKPPLLFFPSLCGETSYAHGVASHLERDQPVWGVQPCDLMDGCQPYRPLEEIARHYADDLCALQPDGPFQLAGFSFGGALAYETACQLVDRGRQLKLVAIIDTGLSSERQPTLAGSLGFTLTIVRNLPNWVLDNILRTEPNGFVANLNNHLKKLANRGSRIVSPGGSISCKPELGDFFDLSLFPQKYVKMMQSNLRALREYTPKRYPGRLTLFRACTRPLLHSQDADLGWREWVTGGVEIISVPGHHLSILKEPSVRVLARNLQSAVDNSS
jgi:thioesterase domain-containing protein